MSHPSLLPSNSLTVLRSGHAEGAGVFPEWLGRSRVVLRQGGEGGRGGGGDPIQL